jgi:hypothetical protein
MQYKSTTISYSQEIKKKYFLFLLFKNYFYICKHIKAIINIMNKNGIKDLMDSQRFRPQHIQKALRDSSAPGNWDSIQNVYNLIKGNNLPKDPYVYVVLANTLNVDVTTVIMRYTTARVDINNTLSKKHDAEDAFNW